MRALQRTINTIMTVRWNTRTQALQVAAQYDRIIAMMNYFVPQVSAVSQVALITRLTIPTIQTAQRPRIL